jgi:DNA-binding NarL/FixJ family response regulator
MHLLTLVSEESKSEKPGDERSSVPSPALRVLIADDHEAVRRGLRSAIWGAGWQVCGEATNGREAISKARELEPDVVILDVSMPVMSGLEAAPEILKSSPGTKVVAFTMHESQQIRNEMARIGVHGLAIKSAPLSNLLDTIKSVASKDGEA